MMRYARLPSRSLVHVTRRDPDGVPCPGSDDACIRAAGRCSYAAGSLRINMGAIGSLQFFLGSLDAGAGGLSHTIRCKN
jgi:hypothetical protein